MTAKYSAITWRYFFILGFLLSAVVGSVNVSQRLDFGLETNAGGREVVVQSVAPGSPAQAAGMRPGDQIRSVSQIPLSSPEQARWYLKGIYDKMPVSFEFQRADSTFQLTLRPMHAFHPGFVILNAILGLTFLIVGFMVWWSEQRDPMAGSFFRLNAFTGVAVLLYSHENFFQTGVFHNAYAFAWLITYCLAPAAVLEFLLRFPRTPNLGTRKFSLIALFYLPMMVIGALLCAMYWQAQISLQAASIALYERLFRLVFGPLLLLYVTAAIARLVYLYLHPASVADRDRSRWLLVCTFIGLAPFICFYKFPIILGLTPLIPFWAANAMMLVIPIGWGMAVASFRLMRLEWTLSRTMVYTITICSLLYLFLTATLISIGYAGRRDLTSLIVLVAIGGLLLVLAIIGLIDKIHRLLDRIYYRDWFNYRQAVQDLGTELTRAPDEESISRILTLQLPMILKLEKATLFLRNFDGSWAVPPQRTPLPLESVPPELLAADRVALPSRPSQAAGLSASIQAMITPLGYQTALLIASGDRAQGLLLLGEKISGASFSLRDHLLLNALSNYAASALANLNLSRRILDHEKRALAADMAGGIAHEINNALGPLMGQAQLLELAASEHSDRLPADKLRPPLAIMVDMCHRIRRIAQNLTRLSQPPTPEMTPLSLNDVVEETLQLLTETAGRIKRFRSDDPTAKFVLQTSLAPDLPIVMADRQQLFQVLTNLILNSADALESQGAGILTVGTRREENPASIIGFVQDTGPGISPELLDKVFQPYFTTKPKEKGTGLGLAIARSIIDAHGGRIHIQSAIGHGTRVEFFLPILPSA